MDPWPKVTEAIIRQHASADSYQRGREYYEQGAVLSIVRRGQQLQAEVEGSQYEPYRTQITCDAAGIAQAICSCPYDWGGWCKHIVATLLAAVHDLAQIDERPALHTLLAGLERDQLQALLVHLVEQRPELADVVEGQIQRLHLQPTGDTPAPRQRHTPIDPNPFRRPGPHHPALSGAQWQNDVDDYGVDKAFEAAMAAAEQGWDYPPLVRVLLCRCAYHLWASPRSLRTASWCVEPGPR